MSPTALLAQHLIIHGRVQGVSYRYAMQQVAQGLGLSGWCRNREDGTVEAVVAGSAGQLEALQTWCQQGPAMAAVTQVTAQPLPHETTLGLPQPFEIRR